jgi:hypothetical protein
LNQQIKLLHQKQTQWLKEAAALKEKYTDAMG